MTPDLPPQAPQVRRAFTGLLAVSAVAGGAAGTYFLLSGASGGAIARAYVLAAAAGMLSFWVFRTGRVVAATHTMITLLLLATLSSAWGRGTTTSMLPLLVAPCPMATTLLGARAGRRWLAASVAVLIVAILRNPGVEPPLEVALAINACLAMLVVGGVTLAFQAMTTRQRNALATTNRELREKEQAARLANRAKSTFLATMSHEIRTPLNAVIGLAEVLGDRPLPAEDQRHVERIQSAGSLLLDLLDSILDLSQIESGVMVVQPQPTALVPLVDAVVLALGRRAEAGSVDLVVNVDPTLPRGIRTDPQRLRQVLINLLGNALKFTQAGTVTTHLGRTEDGNALQIDVTDTGVGIPEAARAHIFDEFRQADEGRDRSYGGSGLGLAISHRLADRLGGSLVLHHTELGQGSTFRLTLPLEAAELPIEAQRSPSPPQTGPWLHVLVVDDDAVNRIVVEAQLRHLGCTVEALSHGAEAVHRLLDPTLEPPDVVLMDQQMPEMDGIEATTTLRAEGVQVPIVALTANAFAEDRDACLAAGMDAFLTKPISRDALHTALESILQPA